MSTRLRFTRWIMLLALPIVATIVVREVKQANVARDALETALQVHNRLRQQLASAEREIRQVTSATSTGAPGSSIASGHTSNGPASIVTSITTYTEQQAVVEPQFAVATHPELRELHLRVFDEEFDGAWGMLLRQLNLPPEKLAAFKALLRGHEEKRLDVTAVAAERNLKLSDAAIQKMRSDDGLVLLNQMRELLGPDDVKVYQQFRRDREVQSVISDLAGRTYFTTTPLTFAESRQLQAILAANSERTANGFVRARTVNWETALTAIEKAGTFSAGVIEASRRVAAEKHLDRQMDERLDQLGTQLVGQTSTLDVWLPHIPPLERRRRPEP